MQVCRVALVDDHRLFRDAVRAMFATETEFKLAAEASSAEEAVAALASTEADVIVVDLVLPPTSGVDLIRRLSGGEMRRRVLALSGHAPVSRISEALRAGAAGFVSKDQPADEWLQAIRTVARGGTYENPHMSAEQLRAAAAEPQAGASAIARLTTREREVFELTVGGASVADIAQQLFVSPRTIETHRSNILHKLGCTNALDLVRLAARLGLIPPQ